MLSSLVSRKSAVEIWFHPSFPFLPFHFFPFYFLSLFLLCEHNIFSGKPEENQQPPTFLSFCPLSFLKAGRRKKRPFLPSVSLLFFMYCNGGIRAKVTRLKYDNGRGREKGARRKENGSRAEFFMSNDRYPPRKSAGG